MKSNVVLQSKDRVLLGMNVSVMSKDGYVCITDAVSAMNKKRKEKGLKDKKVNDIVVTMSFNERCFELVNKLSDRDLLRRRNIHLNDNGLIINNIMDLSKLDWLTDGLIENRNEAGDAYVRMCSAISRIVPNKNDLKDNIKRVAKAINFIVFNKHEDGIRNTASKDELNDIIAIENVIASVVDDGFIKDYNSLISYLGDKWKRKWGNPVLALK